MEAPELFSANLRLIDEVARSVCSRRRVRPADVEDFVSTARLTLIENDYAVLRHYAGRSSLAGFLAVVFDNMVSDQRTRALGRWHPSRAAERMGSAGVLLETLLHRDRLSIDEALPIVRRLDGTLVRGDLESMAAQLPERTPRPRAVPLDPQIEDAVPASESADASVTEQEAASVAKRTSEVIRSAIGSFELEDRMLIRLHFGSKVSIADLSRMFRRPQRPLYRRLEALLRDLRKALADAGVDARSAIDLIGAATTQMNFGLERPEGMEKPPGCQSLEVESEVVPAGGQSS